MNLSTARAILLATLAVGITVAISMSMILIQRGTNIGWADYGVILALVAGLGAVVTALLQLWKATSYRRTYDLTQAFMVRERALALVDVLKDLVQNSPTPPKDVQGLMQLIATREDELIELGDDEGVIELSTAIAEVLRHPNASPIFTSIWDDIVERRHSGRRD